MAAISKNQLKWKIHHNNKWRENSVLVVLRDLGDEIFSSEKMDREAISRQNPSNPCPWAQPRSNPLSTEDAREREWESESRLRLEIAIPSIWLGFPLSSLHTMHYSRFPSPLLFARSLSFVLFGKQGMVRFERTKPVRSNIRFGLSLDRTGPSAFRWTIHVEERLNSLKVIS